MKIFYTRLLLLLALISTTVTTSWARVKIGDLYYDLNDVNNTAMVVSGVVSGDLAIPDKVEYADKEYTVTSIGNNAFPWDDLTSVVIPNSVISIGKSAFVGCTYLTSVEIPNSVTSIGESVFEECSSLTSVEIPNSVISIGKATFNGCTSLTSVVIPNSVISIGESAFGGCTDLTSVEIPNSVTSIGSNAFSGCTSLTSVVISNTVTSIGTKAFYNCSIADIYIPKSIRTIGNEAFGKCKNLRSISYNAENCEITNAGVFYTEDYFWEDQNFFEYNGADKINKLTIGKDVKRIPELIFAGFGISELEIPDNVIYIHPEAFKYCSNLYTYEYEATQATLKYTASSKIYTVDESGKHSVPLYLDNMEITNGKLEMKDLYPEYEPFEYLGFYYAGENIILRKIKYDGTEDLDVGFDIPNYEEGVGVTKIICSGGTWDDGDAKISAYGFTFDGVEYYNNQKEMIFDGLDPETKHSVRFDVKCSYLDEIESKEKLYTSGSGTAREVTTNPLTWEIGETKATSTTSARLQVKTNCDAESGTGIEWRRIDAPDLVPSTKVACPVVDGYLVGSLRNLNPDVYYKFRPYYTSASEKTYYGEWVGLFTGDASVYFEPEVRTFDSSSVTQNSAQITGYALAGSDDINEQGFEYWESDNQPEAIAGYAASTGEHKRVAATGIKMTATIGDLEYGTTYRYRAYVTTAKGSFYGQEYEFTTEKQSGISDIVVDSETDGLNVALRENPATGTAWVKVTGTESTAVKCDIHSLNGSCLMSTHLTADGSWQPVELHIPAGVYLLTVSDSHDCRTARLIVR